MTHEHKIKNSFGGFSFALRICECGYEQRYSNWYGEWNAWKLPVVSFYAGRS